MICNTFVTQVRLFLNVVVGSFAFELHSPISSRYEDRADGRSQRKAVNHRNCCENLESHFRSMLSDATVSPQLGEIGSVLLSSCLIRESISELNFARVLPNTSIICARPAGRPAGRHTEDGPSNVRSRRLGERSRQRHRHRQQPQPQQKREVTEPPAGERCWCWCWCTATRSGGTLPLVAATRTRNTEKNGRDEDDDDDDDDDDGEEDQERESEKEVEDSSLVWRDGKNLPLHPMNNPFLVNERKEENVNAAPPRAAIVASVPTAGAFVDDVVDDDDGDGNVKYANYSLSNEASR